LHDFKLLCIYKLGFIVTGSIWYEYYRNGQFNRFDTTKTKRNFKIWTINKLKIVDHHDISTVNFEINLRHENRILSLSVVLKTKFRRIGIINFNCWRHMHRILWTKSKFYWYHILKLCASLINIRMIFKM